MVATELRPDEAVADEAEPEAALLERPLLAGIGVNWEIVAYAALIVLALVLRLVALGDKPFHHDESQDAYFSWIFYSGGGYKYDPLLHGPLRFYLISLMYLLFGVSNFTARLAPALMGTALVALPFFLRRQLGSLAAFSAAVFLCLCPSYLYFSRFTREDIYFACLTLALMVSVFRFLARPRPWQPALILGLLAASFATKETTFITLFIAGTFFLLTIGWQAGAARRSGMDVGETPVIAAVRSVGLDAWLWGFASFVAVFTLLFTTFFTNPQGLQDGIVKSIQYWLAQQPVGRGDEPWFYYLVLLPAYEWPEILAGAVGLVVVLRRPTLLGCFLIWSFVLSMGIYSWAGEKMPWLLIHPLLPLLMLAGLGVQVLWQGRYYLAGKVGLAIGVLGAVHMLHATTALSFGHPADPAEFLVYTQSATAVPQVSQQVMAIDRRVFDASGEHLKVDIDTTEGVDWPWAWYLRDLHTSSFVDMGPKSAYTPAAQALLIDDSNRTRLLPQLANYTGYRFPLRVWWIPDYQNASVRDWATWLMWRKSWNPEGSLDEWIYLRNDVPGAGLIGATGGAAPATAELAPASPTAGSAVVTLPAATSIAPTRVIAPQSGNSPVLNQPRQVATMPDGSLLVVDQGSNTVTKLKPDGTVAASFSGAGNTALKNPTGVGVDGQGNVFVADTWNHRIVKLDSGLHFITAWGSYGLTGGQADGHPTQFYGPRSIAVDSHGNVYVTDTGNKRIQEFDNNGTFLTQIGGVGDGPGHLNEPVGLAIAPDGNLAVADLWNRRLQILTADGKPVTQWPVLSWQTNVHNEPYVAVGPDGVIYVTDPNVTPGRVLVYSSQGRPIAVWTLSGTALRDPTGLAVSPDNQLYITDSGNQRIVAVAGK
ncbi:MAG: flippase activity-associated protein Agl23 [Chloroflexota bacterium]